VFAEHSAQQLTHTLTSFLGHHDLSRSQAAALYRFYLITIALKHNSYQKLEDDGILQDYFNMFNDIFFYGSLKDYTKVEFKTSQEMGFGCFGHCTSRWSPLNERRNIPDNFAALILFQNLSTELDFCFRSARLSHYLGTLLYEMLHAYYGIYMCRCNRECRKSGKLTVDGRTGHAQLWLEAAIAIERATIPLLGVRLDLGLHGTMCDEYGHNCKMTAPQEVLSALEPLEQEEFHWSEFLGMEKLEMNTDLTLTPAE
jgi:hypothetical protein